MAAHDRGGDEASLSLTDEQIDRFADLIAAGEAEFPDGLSREQEEDLVVRTRGRLRRRLVDLITDQIAADLAHGIREP